MPWPTPGTSVPLSAGVNSTLTSVPVHADAHAVRKLATELRTDTPFRVVPESCRYPAFVVLAIAELPSVAVPESISTCTDPNRRTRTEPPAETVESATPNHVVSVVRVAITCPAVELSILTKVLAATPPDPTV